MGQIKNFRELQVWQKGIEIVKNIYETTKKFPKDETYGLMSQMRRCSVSIPSNIAEGFKRQYSKEFKQFLHISLGSGAELETQLIISQELGYVKEDEIIIIMGKLDHLSKMIYALMKKLK